MLLPKLEILSARKLNDPEAAAKRDVAKRPGTMAMNAAKRWTPPSERSSVMEQAIFTRFQCLRGEHQVTKFHHMVRASALVLLGVAGGPAQAADDPVTIGLVIPLSPPGEPTGGQLIRRGGELAVEYVNGPMGGVMGGRKVRLS